MRTTLNMMLGLALLTMSAPVWAGDFQVNPVRVSLSSTAQAGMVTVSNRAGTPVRLQLQGFAWSETVGGEQVLTPSDRLVIFPTLLELGPGESRRVRVGLNSPPATAEETYRLIVEELPDHRTPDPKGVAIRMRMSIPVFASSDAGSDKAGPRGAITEAQVLPGRERKLRIELGNLGARHFKAGQIEVKLDLKGRPPLTAKLSGWYVLAGKKREHLVTLPKEARCITRATISVETDTAGTLEWRNELVDPACAR